LEDGKMKVKITVPKPRNHAAIAARARSGAGSHRKGEKACRQQAKRELSREVRGF
jgi:hypothetical protein